MSFFVMEILMDCEDHRESLRSLVHRIRNLVLTLCRYDNLLIRQDFSAFKSNNLIFDRQ